MSIFRSVRALFARLVQHKTSEGLTLPLALTEGNYRALQALVQHEGYTTYQDAVDALVTLKGEEMLTVSDTETLHYLRGYITGLRKAATFVEEMMQQENRYLQEEQKRERSRHRSPADARRATFGTPEWGIRSAGDERART